MNFFYLVNVFVFFGIVYPQSAMYVDGENDNIIINGSYQSEEEALGTASAFSIGGTYIFKGNLELGVSLSSAKFDFDDLGSDYDMTSSGYSVGMAYHLKSSKQPVNIVFGGSYSSENLESDYFDDLGIKASGEATLIGVGIYKTVVKNETYEIIPFAQFSSMSITTKIAGEEDSDDSTLFSFGVGIKSNNFFIEPTITQSDGDSDFSITVGMILPQ